MRKTTDQLCDYPDGPASPDPMGGQYRLRIYEDAEGKGAPPVIVVTDASSQGPNAQWISGHAPHLVATIARQHLPATREVQWVNAYSTPDAPMGLFERSRFGLLSDGQAVYHEHFRPASSPAIQPQAAVLSSAEVASLIGQTLD